MARAMIDSKNKYNIKIGDNIIITTCFLTSYLTKIKPIKRIKLAKIPDLPVPQIHIIAVKTAGINEIFWNSIETIKYKVMQATRIIIEIPLWLTTVTASSALTPDNIWYKKNMANI